MRRAFTKEHPASSASKLLSRTAKLPLLISYAYLREERPETIERILTHPAIELLLDSGAFTAMNAGVEISLDEYITFCQRWKDHLFGYMALDVLQNPVATEQNLQVMIKEGLRPIPVHVWGDDQKRMDELFELSDWIALGGFRRPQRGPAPYPYVKLKMEWARGRRVHWLGFTNKPLIEGFRPFSCDCSSWMAGAMYGRVAVYAGRGRWYTYTRDELLQKRGYLKSDLRRALSDYDVTLTEFLDERHWHNGNSANEIKARDCMITKLPARSWVRYVVDLRVRCGTRLFIACHDEQVDWLLHAYELVARKGLLSADPNLHHDTVRGVSQVEGRSGGSSLPAHVAQASVPRPGRKGSHA